MSQKKLLIFDANDTVIDIIKYAKEAGYYAITCDNNPQHEGHKYADKNVFISTYDVESLKKHFGKEEIAGIIYFTSEHGLYAASQLDEFLGVQGITVDTYSKISDKGNFRILLEENGMNYPKYQIITKYEQLDFKKIEFPVIVKPVDGIGGNVGVSKASDVKELDLAVKSAFENSRTSRAIIEEFIESDFQINGDCIVVNGELKGSFLGKHVYEVEQSIIPYATIFSEEVIGEKLKQEIDNEIRKVIKASNFCTGILNVELRVKANGEIYFIEINPRHSGNRIYELMSKCASISMSKLAVNLALNKNIPMNLDMNMKEKAYAYGILYSKENGILKKLTLSEELEKYVVDKLIFKEVGDEISEFQHLRDRLGLLLLEFPTDEVMMRVMENFYHYYTVEVK